MHQEKERDRQTIIAIYRQKTDTNRLKQENGKAFTKLEMDISEGGTPGLRIRIRLMKKVGSGSGL